MDHTINISSLVADPLISRAQDILLSKVISKWRDYRANVFFKLLIQEVSKEYAGKYQSNELDHILKQVLTNSNAEEILFESYRRVCLSSSKNIGPKIIALLTAKLLIDERIANENEESIFELAEKMRDVDFIEFCKFFDNESLKEKLEKSSHRHPIDTQNLGYGLGARTSPSSHLTPTVSLGKWAGKLEQVGFLYSDTVSENFLKESLSKENGTVISYHFSIVIEQVVAELYKYTRRAQGPYHK